MYSDGHNEVFAESRDLASIQSSFITKVYGWMCFALSITGVVALLVATNPEVVNIIFGNRILLFGLFIAEFVIVVGLAGFINRISAQTATAIFIAYSALNGVTFAAIFLVYTASSIASTFFITAGTFGTMSLYGYVTKRDLTKLGNLLFMALIGLIIASVVNMFWSNSILYWITTYAGVIIFVGLTAYDTQKIKAMASAVDGDFESGRKCAVMGALSLYLDFINLFLFLLRIFGSRR
ncbi:MAG: hypothetical protein A2020_06135 [Lentisphaerae bacterium GWF2_45_14]|nr:MAG: hypothetical protein A2020_06135 [Lentisphaerae bacterium GWF2_45_14]